MKELVADQIVGNYRVIRRIGRGGMGSVYEVESVDLHERFALKTFTYDPKDDDGDVLKNKFLEEGKILARLRHPNIAHVYSLAYDKELELLYFVMDLVLSEDGRPYSVENASFADLEEDTALAWFTDVCEALDYIHSQGIVHRDIKPGNLLVKPDGHIVLTDFGIAKINSGKMKEEVNPAMTMRIDGNITVLGSNHYIAPEVDAGGEVTAAADAYSLGVMMFEMLTGKWYDKVEDPWALLKGRKYPWVRVLKMFLDPDPTKRPLGYAAIAKRMPNWGTGNGERGTGERGTGNGKFGIWWIIGLLIAGGAAVMVMRNSDDVRLPEPQPLPQVTMPAEEGETPESAAETDHRADRDEPEPVVEISPAAEKVPAVEKRLEPSVEPKPGKKVESKSELKKEKKAEVKAMEEKLKKVDYGPIPNKTYSWFTDGKAAQPAAVDFALANGMTIGLLPYAPTQYLMTDAWDMGTHAHLVDFTRPYWISRFCIEPSVLREWKPKDFEDCREVEAAVGTDYKVYRSISYRRILAFCEFLTAKYGSQLPKGYVFRLPTEAEWDRAVDRAGYAAAAAKPGADPNHVKWREHTCFNHANMRAEFVKIRQTKGLDRFGKWEDQPTASGFLIDKGILIGGRSLPTVNGVYDVAFGTQPMLDVISTAEPHVYAEHERDPLQGGELPKGSTDGVRVVGRSWMSERVYLPFDSSFVFHLAVGPDLRSEKAWETRVVSENPVETAVPAGHYDWNPKRIPSKLSRPKELDLKLVNGAKMKFCAVPKGKFTMSNIPGQPAKSHKVELSYAFWMSKYCVTTEQRRDYGKYDCEGFCQKVEGAFPGEPVYCAFNRWEWEHYCRFLTERYRAQIPEGYVFRLPTEAEYEWAFVADEKAEVSRVDSRFCPADKCARENFAKRLKKERKSLVKDMDGRGFVDPENVCLGGLAEPNVFGIHDIWLDGWGQWTYDLYDYDSFGVQNGSPERNVFYHEKEKDPCHYDGRVACGGLVRSGRTGRTMRPFDSESRAHIVLGPDFAAPIKKAEQEPCPDSDFGGKFIEGVTVHSLSSEHASGKWCLPERLATLVTRDPAVVGARGRAFLTQPENAPWVQLELSQRMTLSGVVIETHANRGYTAHLTVWISDDGKRWREIGKEIRTLGRYRFDFKGKNANRVKYVRIGREPGYVEEAFALHKVWLYGHK